MSLQFLAVLFSDHSVSPFDRKYTLAHCLIYGVHYSTDYETKDGSIYSYTGWRIQIYGGYQWYFENNVSFVIGLGPSYLDSGKKSESLKSTADYDKDVEDYVKNGSFQPINSIPLLLVGYTF